ncbi:uncharacterized protein LOC105216121 [Zeugodacus cucurbitae]|uniref:Uncharacterized protein L147 n=1 Tax=Zeugodacus cucurbitae TaxID=28588 RepID=A0A0A1X0C2_ZEUCU|nr:uncharacterized protein LOC105216121 [Zeugodacus cucurbitae]
MKSEHRFTGRARASLPQIVLRVQLYETNFTAVEVAALRAAWTLIEPKIKKISRNIAFDAYTDNPIWVEFFRFENKIDGKIMILNPLWLLNIYGDIIKSNLCTNYAVAKIVRPILEAQLSQFLPMPHLAFLLEYVERGIYNELKDHLSPTTYSGFEKLYKTMLYFLRLTEQRSVVLSTAAPWEPLN